MFDWLFGSSSSRTSTSTTSSYDPAASSSDRNSSSKIPKHDREKVEKFVNQSPNSTYSFDTPYRDAPEADLCRKQQGKLSCIKVAIESRLLFEHMQRLGYFCQLPFDPTRTEIECRRIEMVTGMPLDEDK